MNLNWSSFDILKGKGNVFLHSDTTSSTTCEQHVPPAAQITCCFNISSEVKFTLISVSLQGHAGQGCMSSMFRYTTTHDTVTETVSETSHIGIMGTGSYILQKCHPILKNILAVNTIGLLHVYCSSEVGKMVNGSWFYRARLKVSA